MSQPKPQKCHVQFRIKKVTYNLYILYLTWLKNLRKTNFNLVGPLGSK